MMTKNDYFNEKMRIASLKFSFCVISADWRISPLRVNALNKTENAG